MRFIVALCFLVALWTVDANIIRLSDDLDDLRSEKRDAKWEVEDIIHQLQLLRTQSEEDTNRKVTDKWDEEQDSYRSYKNLLLTEIRKIINDAKNKKNAETCYKDAKDGIQASENITNNDANKCIDVASDSIDKDLGFLDNLISTANDLSSELDSIFLDCHDSDESKQRGCIVSELADIKNDIKTLNNDVNSAQINILHMSDNVILLATNCLKKAYSIVYSAGSTILNNLSQCIENPGEVTESLTTTRKATTQAPIKRKATTQAPIKSTTVVKL